MCIEAEKFVLRGKQEFYRTTRQEPLSGIHYHVTTKKKVRDKIHAEGLRPATAETKRSSGLDTEGKLYICKELDGEWCSAARWIKVFSEKDGGQEDEYCILMVNLDDMAYPDAYSSCPHDPPHSWIIENTIERRRILGIMVSGQGHAEWLTVDLDDWLKNQ